MDTLTLRREEDPEPRETFLDRYSQWAATRTDAPIQYHITAAVVILSALMAPHAVLPTSYAEIRPNIWAMILAGTTITRKSTSMDMALRVLDDVHPDYLMATDGSPEGLLSELSFRDGKVSLFHRDEITGFISSTANREYLAGLLETLTRLYDGRREKRILRRETIDVKDPRFIMLCGGIKEKMQAVTSVEHIQSGFIPRFLITTGSTTVEQMRPIGPPTHEDQGEYDPREDILKELFDIANFWMPSKKKETITVGGMKKTVHSTREKMTMQATERAWERIRQLQNDAIHMGERSVSPSIYTPVYSRLTDSIVKIAMLLAGAEQRMVIEFDDVTQAISYSDIWLLAAAEFAQGVEDQPDFTPFEKKLRKVIAYIISRWKEDTRVQTSKSDVMRRFHIRQKDIQDIEKTLVERGLIRMNTSLGRRAANGKGAATRGKTTYEPTDLALSGPESDTLRLGEDESSVPSDGGDS